ncbi:hypothetical protein HYH03_000264 [Edaphochlamys debaryana]|uniref:Expansin-like EG45 domain-containing protein n=1 Tax=Edaphochlamys debaryana TaxID=47281 RepID=A0A835YH96_9CHLO|nr:hypothetical protein HYH03_000264 [Edaphochlamys debaryana]|eukprot:KAG2501764.1 hypothetical protein HYH03_000264 [Edaphochlamys debaryana]
MARPAPAAEACAGPSGRAPMDSPPQRCRRSAPGSSLVRTLAAVVVVACLPLQAVAWDGWTVGRATFYGYDGGATIHQGSCMYGGLPNYMVSTGMDIAALSDTAPDYSGSCGRCYEVMCNPASFSDGYGNWMDRSGACYEGGRVIVTITDTCPCYYPSNEYSNKRWCCGDMQHMDLSQEAFSKIGNTGMGVIGIKYRQVECPGGFHASPRKATWDFPAGSS